ncbi:MAG: radical SAM protein [Sphingomonadales bacterium]
MWDGRSAEQARVDWGRDVAHVSSGTSFLPEDNPFAVVFADITHRCNMACLNCYIPNRDVPDMDADWLMSILRRLPRRTRIRLVGAEPTVRKDLPDLIRRVRNLGHHPVILTNGLTLARPGYARTLKKAGLHTIYLSMNGGLNDDCYDEIDGLRCAKRKMRALEVLSNENFFTTIGMILVRGVNEGQLKDFIAYLRTQSAVRDFHIRSIGQFGRYMEDSKPFSSDELSDIVSDALEVDIRSLPTYESDRPSHTTFKHRNLHFQLTEWPDLGSPGRGRITPEGKIEPCFENIIANDGQY